MTDLEITKGIAKDCYDLEDMPNEGAEWLNECIGTLLAATRRLAEVVGRQIEEAAAKKWS